MGFQSCVLPALWAALAAGSVFAQGELTVYRGSLVAGQPVSGKVALLPDALVFVDDEKPESSFYAPRSGIQSVTADADMVTIQLNKGVKDRAGSTNRVILRFSAASEATAVQRWHGNAPAAAPAAEAGAGVMTFSAQRKKRLRSNTDGKLIIDNERLMFESTDNASDSRRWDLKEIKELKHDNPYELEIRPFRGDKYELIISGSGMDNAQFREIVDRVTRSRTTR